MSESASKSGRKDLKILKIILCVLAAVIFSAGCFFAGFFTHRATVSKQAASLNWLITTVSENYYKEIPEEELKSVSIAAIKSNYLDKYSRYYTAEEYAATKQTNQGNMSGVGLSYSFLEEGEHPDGKKGVIVEGVVFNSPAYLSGLKTGEFIYSARDSAGVTAFDTANSFANYLNSKAAEEQFTFVTDRGEHTLSKQNYTASYCAMSTSSVTWSVSYAGGDRIINESAGIKCLPDGAAYLKLNQFYGGASDETALLAERFNASGCTSLILDLRGNGGGSVNVMRGISEVFLGNLPEYNNIAMRAVYRDGKEEIFKVTDKYQEARCFPKGIKVSVLADCNTASASEALIGVLIDNGICGYGDIYISDLSEKYLSFTSYQAKNCKTYGKGIMQTTFENDRTGEAIKLTTAKIYWPNGETCIHDTGLTKDMGCKTVKTTWDVVYGDPQLAEAVKLIYGL